MQTTAPAIAAATVVPRYVLGGAGFTPPSDKLNIAMIGVGGQGMQNTRNLLQQNDVQIVAIADTEEWADYSRFYHAEPGGRKPTFDRITRHYASNPATADWAECSVYIDFRRMLDQEKDYDAVVISTPDHTHAVAAMAAIDRKKHIYIEKPLARTISEVRKLTSAAKQAGIITQLGHQGHGDEGIRLTREWIQHGAIGEVTEVHSWSDGPNKSAAGRPAEQPPAPAGLDWDLWIGPAPYRAYHPEYTPCGWRYYWDFGTAKIGDMGSHNMDPAFFALDLGYPEWVEARSAWGDREKRPYVSIVHYQFLARGQHPPVRLIWYEGLMPPRPEELELGRDLTGDGNGILFVGEKGKIMCPGWAGNPRIIPEAKMREYTTPPKTLPRVGGIYRDWINACKTGEKASSDWSYSGPFIEAILAGVVAMRIEEKLYWNWTDMKANHPDAEQYIFPEYQNGWTL
ncbi:Gfo/Idh/MocA family oxidoreductase [candidate division KSB1 bacterium]|nr:Gfo/Idh/MocA family oxidoreductase [candidate division KSB1 bacterium]RQW06053.1 MAG: gfo/Idh/MocA family oxidoreductase [candidate division KSB1 bacterium]